VHIVVSGYPAPARPLPRERSVGALLVARERCGAHPEHGAHRAGEGQLRVLGPDHAGARVFTRECRLIPVANLGRGKRAALERIANGVGRHAAEWMVEWAELGRGGA
jgi:hypothetical protein